jgi:hypothetical protein
MKKSAINVGVHVTHCCAQHGCKYGDDRRCPVASGRVKQEGPCETCGGAEAFSGDFYQVVGGKLVWRPNIIDIVRKVAKQLGPHGRGKLSAKALAELQFAAQAIQDDPDLGDQP